MRAFERRPIRGIRGHNPIPERRMRLLHRFQYHRHLVEFVEFTAEGELVRRQALLDDFQGLWKLTWPVCRINAVEADLDRRHSSTDTELEATMAHLIKHANFFNQPDRMIEGQRINQRAESKTLCPLRTRRQEQARRRSQAKGRAVVLRKMICVETVAIICLDE